MPFRSEAQRRFMYSQHPELAKEFQSATPKGADLPEHVKKMAYGGETNAKHETLSSMQNNPTAGFAEGGEATNYAEQLEPGIYGNTDPGHFKSIIDALGGGMAVGSLGAGLGVSGLDAAKGLGEAGEITIGRVAPKMEEALGEKIAPKVEVYSKGWQKDAQGKPVMEILNVRGAPEEVSKLGFGPNPGSIPESVLRQHGLLPDAKASVPGMEAPNSFAHGGEVMNYADGGDVNPSMDVLNQIAQLSAMHQPGNTPPSAPIMPQAQPSQVPQTPPAPPMQDMATKLNQTPNTNYDFYKDISAEDRAKLYQQLTANQKSPAALIAQGAGGLGDAIARSFGGQNTNYQKDIMANTEAQKQGALGAMDTQRTQRMQDLQGNTEAMANDPNSPLSKSMQATFKQAGINVPSGMPGSMLMKIAPALGELAMKQATMEMTKQNNLANQGLRQNQQDLAEQEFNANHWIRNLFGGGVKAGGQQAQLPIGQTATHPSGVKITRIQ